MLYLVTGRFRQQHWPSPTGYASEPQDQHALQQQQCMPPHRASHGGLGLARLSSGLKGPKHWIDTPGKDREEEIIHDSLLFHSSCLSFVQSSVAACSRAEEMIGSHKSEQELLRISRACVSQRHPLPPLPSDIQRMSQKRLCITSHGS